MLVASYAAMTNVYTIVHWSVGMLLSIKSLREQMLSGCASGMSSCFMVCSIERYVFRMRSLRALLFSSLVVNIPSKIRDVGAFPVAVFASKVALFVESDERRPSMVGSFLRTFWESSLPESALFDVERSSVLEGRLRVSLRWCETAESSTFKWSQSIVECLIRLPLYRHVASDRMKENRSKNLESTKEDTMLPLLLELVRGMECYHQPMFLC